MKNPELTGLIGSRICHDLISPVGAINNGVELLAQIKGTSPEMDLIAQSAATAQAKLEYFRIAFGASGTGEMGMAAVKRIAQGMFHEGRVSVDFQQDWGERSRDLIKLFFLTLLCVESSLPRGGVIECTPTVSGWELRVSGSSINVQADLWSIVTSGKSEVETTSGNIHFALCRASALSIQMTISTTISADDLRVRF